MAAVAVKHALFSIMLRPAIKYIKWSPVIYIRYFIVIDGKCAMILMMYGSDIRE